MTVPRPVIGISGPDQGGFMAWWFSALAIRRAGGKPIRITPKSGYRIEALDGVILGGGADIEPDAPRSLETEYNATREAARQAGAKTVLRLLLYPVIYLLRRLFSIKHTQHFDKDRDRIEFSLLADAIERRLPVLGICRGAQLLNEHLGGSLHQDIRTFYEEAPLPRSVFPVKKIRITTGSLLHKVLQQDSCRINALHHQAVDTTGEQVKVSAREDNGIVQAIEVTGDTYLLGVQWHPEYLPLERNQRRLFEALVKAAGERHPQ